MPRTQLDLHNWLTVYAQIVSLLNTTWDEASFKDSLATVLRHLIDFSGSGSGSIKISSSESSHLRGFEVSCSGASFCFEAMSAPGGCVCGVAIEGSSSKSGVIHAGEHCAKDGSVFATCVPIMSGGTLAGLFMSLSHGENQYAAEFRNIAETVCGHIGETYSRLKRIRGGCNETDLETVNAVGRLVTSRLTLKEMVREIVQNLGAVIETDEVNVIQYDSQRMELKFLASYFADGAKLERPEVYPLSDGMNSWIIKNRKQLLIRSDTVSECAALGIRHGGAPAKSWLGVPMILKDKIVGVLSIQSYGKAGLYDERASELLTAVAGQCAVAMENAKLYEEALEREMEKERLYFSLTHDLLSLVSPVAGFARLLKSLPEDVDREKVTEMINSLVNSTQRITRFVEDILVYAKIKSGKLALNIERSDVFRVVYPVVAQFSPEISLRKLSISVNGQKAEPGKFALNGGLEADFDVAQMERVFLNLLGNAVKYSKSEISLNVESTAQEVICFVKNDGHGVPDDQVKMLFDEYYQASSKNRGVGLGLPTVKRIVELHHGTIGISSGENKGFCVKFTWPRTLADRREAPEARMEI